MTSERFERQLPTLLEDLYLGPPPNYRDEVLVAATRRGQRPAWAVPGRWIPMDIARRSTLVPRLPWRTLSVALVVLALLLAAAIVLIGTRPTRLPAPFGPADNGQIVFAADGDIFTGDPVRGTSRAIVTGPAMDGNPRFSRDGTHVAFMRQSDKSVAAFDLVVTDANGNGLRVLGTALDTDNPYEWSPDGSYLVFTDSEFRVFRFDVTGATPPKLLIENAYVQPGEFRPPDGRQILYEPQGTTGHELWVMSADGSDRRPVVQIPADRSKNGDFGRVSYSPDGTQIVYTRAPAGDTNQLRVFVVNADGTAPRQVTNEPGTWTETDPAWSPDGSSIVFDRWRQDQKTLAWNIMPLGISSVESGDVRSIGVAPVSDGAWFDFSPDGQALVSIPGTILNAPYPANNVQPTTIEISTGKTRTLDWQVGSVLTWQRLAH
jgi:Tol biopolymer transport system component